MKKENAKKKIKLLILAISILLTISGILFGDIYNGVFIKAINICLECIGIG